MVRWNGRRRMCLLCRGRRALDCLLHHSKGRLVSWSGPHGCYSRLLHQDRHMIGISSSIWCLDCREHTGLRFCCGCRRAVFAVALPGSGKPVFGFISSMKCRLSMIRTPSTACRLYQRRYAGRRHSGVWLRHTVFHRCLCLPFLISKNAFVFVWAFDVVSNGNTHGGSWRIAAAGVVVHVVFAVRQLRDVSSPKSIGLRPFEGFF